MWHVWRRGEVWGNLRKGDHLEDPGVDGRIVLRWIFRKWSANMVLIDLAQYRDTRRALLNFRVP
jgi:hypothetical protein